MLRFSVLDQSIVPSGSTASQAITNTIQLAKQAEVWGFHRFWVSEHHNSAMIAGSAPELLMVRLANETSNLRIGSGGIMLPNHSALKVAENFRQGLTWVWAGPRAETGLQRHCSILRIIFLKNLICSNWDICRHFFMMRHLHSTALCWPYHNQPPFRNRGYSVRAAAVL